MMPHDDLDPASLKLRGARISRACGASSVGIGDYLA
jgi:hypothetical protein